jgi:hypothetical protein
MIIAPRRHRHPSSCANRPPDIAVTVNFNPQLSLLPGNPIIECCSKDLVPEYCQGFEASAVSNAPPVFIESLHGRSNRSVPRMPLHVHAEVILPTFLTSNINIRLYLPKVFTLTRLRCYEMFEVLLIVRINKSLDLRGAVFFHLLGDRFPYWLARWVPHKEGVPYPLQSKVRIQPPTLRCTILALQISLNAWLPPHPLHCDGQ